MTMLITGASGFVGRHLTKIKGDFRCVVRSGKKNTFPDSYVVSAIDANTQWNDCFHGVESIIHLAGLAHSNSFTFDDYKRINTEGTLRLALKAAEAGVKRFVFVSSIGVNGPSTSDTPFTVDHIATPHNAYTLSKFEAEVGLKKISRDTGLEVVIVRPTLVYGPSAPGNFGMLTKLVSKLPILPFGLANNRRSFIAVQNLADFLLTCAVHPDAHGCTFLASDSEVISTKVLTNSIAEGLGKRVIQLPIPVRLMRIVGKLAGKSDMIEQLYGNLEVDSSNAKSILGWTPPLTMKQAMGTMCEIRKKY